MARNTSMIKRGFSWDNANSTLDLYVNGTEVATFSTTTVNFPNTASVWNFGTSDSPLSYTAGAPAFTLYATNAGTSGSTSAEPFYVKSTLTGAGQVGGRSRFHCYSNVASGGWINALKAYMEFGSSGRTTGLASALCAEIYMPATNAAGSYCCLEAEMYVPASAVTGSTTSFIYMNVDGDSTAITSFNTNGYLFQLGSGVADTSGGLFDVVNADDIDATAALKIKIANTDYFIPISTTSAFNA